MCALIAWTCPFLSGRCSLLANFLERRACEPRAERDKEDFQFPIMSCMHTWDGMRQHDQGNSTIRDLILDSGNAVLRERADPGSGLGGSGTLR